MQRMKKWSLAVLVCAAMSMTFVALAGSVPAKVISLKELRTGAQIKADIKKLLGATKKAKGSGRVLAEAEARAVMSGPLKERLDALYKVNDADGFQKFVTKLEHDYDAPESDPDKIRDNDLKFFAARILPIQAYAGIVWKMYNVFKDYRMAREFAVGFLRGLFEQMEIRFPEEHNLAALHYLTEPVSTTPEFVAQFGEMNQRWKTEADVQRHFRDVLYPAMTKAISRIEAIHLTTPILVDAQIRYGIDYAPQNNLGRYHLVGELEKEAALARMHRRAFVVCTYLGYSLDHYFEWRAAVGSKYGFDVARAEVNGVFSDGNIIGITREGRVGLTREFAAKGLFRKVDEAKLVEGYDHLYRSVTGASGVWQALRGQNPQDHDYLLNYDLFQGRTAEIDEGMKNLVSMVTAPAVDPAAFILDTSVTENVKDENGKVVTKIKQVPVNMQAFFIHAPNNLTELMPRDFQPNKKGADKYANVSKEVNGKKEKYRDYEAGRAIAWDSAPYQYLFPGVLDPKTKQVKSERTEAVADYERALFRTRGGRFLASSLIGFIR